MFFKKNRKQPGFAELLAYSHMVHPGTLQLKNGGLVAGFWLQGPDLESSSSAELEYLSDRFARTLAQLDTRWHIHFEFFRRETTEYPAGNFTETTAEIIDLERYAQFNEEGRHYESLQALFITYLPASFEQNALYQKANKLLIGDENEAAEDVVEKQLSRFEDVLTSIGDSLSLVLGIQRMNYAGAENRENPFGGNSEILQAINACVNNKWHTVKLPRVPEYLDCLLAMDMVNGEWLKYDEEYVLTVSIANHPSGTFPGILEELQKLPIALRWSNRFILTDQQEALAHMNAKRRKWEQKIRSFFSQITGIESTKINQDAVTMVNDLDNAIELAQRGEIVYGHHTSTVVLRHKNPQTLHEMAREVVKAFEKTGTNAHIENLNNIEAFLGSLPGHGFENIRKPLVNALNFSDIVPLSNDWVGEEFNPCPFYPPKSPSLLQAATTGSTPFRFNLHVGDVGHAVVLGPTGSGKSTFLGTLAAQFLRYEDAQVFFFDNGRSIYPLSQSLKNSVFYDLGHGSTDISLCPLAEIDQPEVFEWAVEWLETLIEMVEPAVVTPQRRSLLIDALKNLANSTTCAEERTLTQYITSLQDGKLKAALEFYSVNQSGGLLLDGERNDISYSMFNVFEISALLGRDKIAPAVLTYLFFQIQRRLRGKPSVVIIDEAWTALKNPLFSDVMRNWLKTFRKLNCSVVLATQSLTDVVQSNIRDAVLESCPTKILLANPEARGAKAGELYRDYLQLNTRQINIVARMERKRQYYVISPKAKRIFSLGLGPIALSFVGASGIEDLTRIEILKNKYGEKWPARWLTERGYDVWAEEWLKVDQKKERAK